MKRRNGALAAGRPEGAETGTEGTGKACIAAPQPRVAPTEVHLMITQSETCSLDALVADPAKAAALLPETAQALLIGLSSIYPILLQRALTASPNEHHEEDILLTIPQVAKRLKISDYRAYELARQGMLKCVRFGKSVRVRPSAVEEYVAKHGT